jgi:O-antigen/teichoic acid export membrane protein
MSAACEARAGEPIAIQGSRRLLSGAIWTFGAYGAGQALRLLTNVLLARLLAPQLFGVMQVVHSLRTGVELITDVGVGQNIIYHAEANDPEFYDTAWSLQLLRGVALALIFCLIAYPVAGFYESPVLFPVILISSLGVAIGGATSTSRFLLQKRMKFGAHAALETGVAFASFAGQVMLAWAFPNIWGMVAGSMVGVASFALASHFVMPDVRHRFRVSRAQAVKILSFGKWIFASSIVYFLAMNFDRLFFAKAIPFELLGIYGIARTLSDLAGAAVAQLGGNVIFPFVASHLGTPRAQLRAELAPIRLRFLLLAALAFALFAASSDFVIRILYDQRYQAATWMLPMLVIGAWFTILANINESALLGLGRPNFNVFAHSAKFLFLLLGLAWSVPRFGVVGGVVVVALSDLCRYFPMLFGQYRERFAFAGQDLLATLAVLGLLALFEWARALAGFGDSLAPAYEILFGRAA